MLVQGRDRIYDLRSDTNSEDELSESLARYGNGLAQARTPSFSMKVTGAENELDPIVRDEVFRIGREALGNAFKHSNGSEVAAEILYDPGAIKMRIRDNGIGIDPEVLLHGRPGHWGLSGMHERADRIGATLSIWSRPTEGTELELVPAGSPFRRTGIEVATLEVEEAHFKRRRIAMTAPRKIRVLAVDDHLLLRKGIAAVIEEEEDLSWSARPQPEKKQSSDFGSFVRTSRSWTCSCPT